jgi:hypothetical protein
LLGDDFTFFCKKALEEEKHQHEKLKAPLDFR